MKRLIVLFLTSAILVSCGKDKKNDVENNEEAVALKDNFSVVLEAVYEKDDSLSVVYKKGGYWDYDHPVPFKVIGQPNPQKLTILIPEGDKLENVQITLSTNKEQKTTALKSVAIFNNQKEVFNGANMSYIKYFDSNSGLIWDEKNMRNNLNFDGQYPPGIAGNQNLEAALAR